jgi:RHS repeat-associated protein
MLGRPMVAGAPEPGADAPPSGPFSVQAPVISLPKGGGAIRGIGEKFAANPVTGTGSVSVPIATSPGRSGFGPQLSLSYDSGAGNGPFGFGWSLSLPSITRKTDKGLPQYLDTEDSDVFMLSGAEDLVPIYRQDPDGTWVAKHPGFQRDADGFWVRDPFGRLVAHEDELDGYRVRRYRPRIEGLFARIERWSKIDPGGAVHWRSISKDNILTLYGQDPNSRIFDPLDASRIFSWLICESRDDKGNAIRYLYREEDGARQLRLGQPDPLGQAHQHNRGAADDPRRTAQRYLGRVLYGNTKPLLNDEGHRPRYLSDLAQPPTDTNTDWLFEVRFDYGELDEGDPTGKPERPWLYRPDAFSSYREGFEVRTCRRCERVLMLHHIPDQPAAPGRAAQSGYRGVVRSTEFTYDDELNPSLATRPIYSFLKQVVQTGWKQVGGSTTRRSLPPLEFAYTEPVVQGAIAEVDPASLENLPVGLDGSAYRWTDLHGEGIPGILAEQVGAWYYKRNWSPVPDKLPDGTDVVKAKFSPLETVALRPNVSLGGGAEFMDLAGDGQPDVVVMDAPMPGLYEHDDNEGWQPFRPFTSRLNRAMRDPNLKFVDLDGDGHADVLITEDEAFVWHASLAEEGFGSARRVAQALEEEQGPRIVFADGTQSIYLADLSGDGLTDLARIRTGEVCYWPNLGFGRFGAKVTMDNAPSFDNPDQFDHKRIRLADIDGSGTTDIIYLHRDGIRLYFNQSGNSWSIPHLLNVFPNVDDVVNIVPTDLLGNGTACLVWSSPLPGDAQRPMRYINLMGKDKPHLLVKVRNNLGATTDVRYAPSTKFYLQDKRDGQPWITRLPFPVHVVERVSVTDHWRGTTFATTYSYHHGYFDSIEREFRGFGRVEQIDTEDYGKFSAGNADSPYITPDHKLYQPPVKAVTWFHTGAFIDEGRVLSQYTNEYFPNWLDALRPQTTDVLGGFQENTLPEPDFADMDLTTEEWREALRACKGMPLRQEIYELDVKALRDGAHRPVKLFSTAYHNCHIDRLQPRDTNRHAVFLVTESEAITYHYELDLRAAQLRPDPRASHTLNLRIDEFGHVLQSVAVGYPRFLPFDDTDAALDSRTVSLIRKVQSELHIAYTETRYTDELKDTNIVADNHRLPLPCEIKIYELTGIKTKDAGDSLTSDVRDDRYFSIDELRAYRLSEHYRAHGKTVGTLQYHQQPERTSPSPAQKRLVEHVRTLYFDDASGAVAPTEPLAFGRHGPRGLKYETYKLALTDTLLTVVYGAKLAQSIAGSSANQRLASATASGYLSGSDLADRFNPLDTIGQFWMRSGVASFAADATQHFFLPERYEDSFGNVTQVAFDSRDLYVESTKDPRGNEVRIIDFDFRVLAPRAVQDSNGNVMRAAFDVLRMPVAMALESGGDSLAGMTPNLLDPSPSEVARFMTLEPYTESDPRRWLGKATSRLMYHLGEVVDANGRIMWEARPAAACAIRRETHVAQLAGQETNIQTSIEYSDGGGNVFLKKAQAEPDPDNGPQNAPLRWIASGKPILNNKGKSVKQYEPYFSRAEHRFDEAEATSEVGATPVMYYDAPGRLIRTELPDGTFTYVEFSPWHVKTFDANDTAFDIDPGNRSDWYRRRSDPTHTRYADFGDTQNARTAELTERHANTPTRTYLDSLGREVVAVAHNRTPDANGVWQEDFHVTFTKLDVEGKPLWIRDARGNLVMQYITEPKPTRLAATPADPHQPSDTTREYLPDGAVPCYDIAGNLLFQHSMDSGERWMLMDAAGKPMLAWDLNDHGPGTAARLRMFHTEYDALHRPTKQWLKIDTSAAALVEAFVYCDTDGPLLPDGQVNLVDAKRRNLIGQAVRHFDPSGLSTVERIDLSGKPAHITRRLLRPGAESTEGIVDWSSGDGPLEAKAETFRQIIDYDALGRVTRLYNWHRDITFGANGAQPTPGTTNRVSVYEPEYNERGVLVSESLHVRATKTTSLNDRVGFSMDGQRSHRAIKRITYNAKGQKLRLELGEDVNTGVAVTTTRYTYDPETFRLTHLITRRHAAIAANDCTSNTGDAPRPQRPCGMQNLHYTYDAVGNITHIQDDAQQTAFFANSRIEPSSAYIYDALYRLIEATGREYVPPIELPRHREGHWPTGAFPSAEILRNYTQRYHYDAAGNFVMIKHVVGVGTGWTRRYTTKVDSNRLDQTWYGSNATEAVTHRHDAHGNMLNLNQTTPPPSPGSAHEWGLDIRWDWRDMILGFDMGGGGLARYHYGIDKQRTRKHVTRPGGIVDDRIYLGGYELYRRYSANTTAPVEEVESHHLFEGNQRVLLVDDVLAGGSPRPSGLSAKAQTLFRYQYSNQVGSSCLELDHQGGIISYEEYHPYGTSAYRAMKREVEAPPKRYRYTGMERDEESGLSYHKSRYYAVWLGRWLSCDPEGLVDGTDVYRFVWSNPIRLVDRGGTASVEDSVKALIANEFKLAGVSFSTEVWIRVTMPDGSSVIGRPDIVFVDPQSGKLQFLEAKGVNPSAFTDPQEQYIREVFQKQGGNVELIASNETLAKLRISPGDKAAQRVFVKEGANFGVVFDKNVNEFLKHVVPSAKGYVYSRDVGGEREYKRFTSEQEMREWVEGQNRAPLPDPESKAVSENRALAESASTPTSQIDDTAAAALREEASVLAKRGGRELLHAIPIITVPMQLHDAEEDFERGERTHGMLNALGLFLDPVDIGVAIADLATAALYGMAALDAAQETHAFKLKTDPAYRKKQMEWQREFERMTSVLEKKMTVGNRF